MSTTHDRPTTDRCPIAPRHDDHGRYVALDVEDDVLIFDAQVATAWVKSDNAIELESME